MSKLVYCGHCRREFAPQMAPEGCPVCGAPVRPAKLTKPADPRVVKPVGNREVKPR